MWTEQAFCHTCQRETRHTNIDPSAASKCDECASRELIAAEAEWRALLDAEKIERLRRRIEKLEQRHHF